MRIFSEEGYLSADFGARALVMIGRERGMPLPALRDSGARPSLDRSRRDAGEHAAFTASILDGARSWSMPTPAGRWPRRSR